MSSAPGRVSLVGSTWLLLVSGVVLLWVYGYRIAANPAKWEEPRRCLVAMEMIQRGDYVVPRLLGRPYLNKPPLQNWLIALAAGNRVEGVSVLRARMVSLAALVGICLMLWRLGLSGLRPRADPAPAAIFLTFGLAVQFGRVGEIDMLFAFWITAALACVELGRRHDSRLLRWVAPQPLLAAAVLTKGLAPLFFYPPMLYMARRHPVRARADIVALAAGVAIMLALVGLWLVPYSTLAPTAPLRETWTAEILKRTVDVGAGGWLKHLALYPLLVVGIFLPWSLSLAGVGRRAFAELRRTLRADPWLQLCAAVTLWGLAMFIVVPAVKDRYLLPVLPCAAVLAARLLLAAGPDSALTRLSRQLYFWLTAAALLVGVVLLARAEWLERFRDLAWLPLLLGAASIGAFAFAVFVRKEAAPGIPLLFAGLLYGIVFSGIAELKEAERTGRFVDAAAALQRAMVDERPVLVHGRVDRRLSYGLSRLIGRPVQLVTGSEQAYYLVAPLAAPARRGAARIAMSWDYALYDVGPPEGWSLLQRPLYPPVADPEVLAAREAALEQARRRHAEDPDDVEATIWLGRRLAYLGRYRQALAVFGDGIARHPREPRLYRHLGHRQITLRRFAAAVADLERAAELCRGRPDAVEPDGLPNPAGIPRTTTQFNVWYHLGLAHYLRGDHAAAAAAFRGSLDVARNDDTRVAATHWLYMTLCRLGRTDEARTLLEPIAENMEILENGTYHELLLMYKGRRDAEALLRETAADAVDGATLGYGIGNWHLYEGRPERAFELFRRIVAGESWAAFGFIAAEAELARARPRRP